ncbi:hypothetical protein BGZ50_009035 [Haplosporangium sp. Z 11]|nr:hypothetical protein BGZ50_009035 [Haplosporangium sp. Z 11]
MLAFQRCYELLDGRLRFHSDKSTSTWWTFSAGEVLVNYHPLSPHWYGYSDVPFRYIQEAYDALSRGINGYVYESFEAIIKNDEGVAMGVLQVNFYPDEERRLSSPKSLPAQKFTTGVHYFPWNETIPMEAPFNDTRNAASKIGVKPLRRCLRHDTIVSGSKISSGSKLYSANGNFVELQSDGNLCSTAFGTKNWCMMSNHPHGEREGPFTMEIGKNGHLAFRDKTGGLYVTYGIGNYPPKDDGYFRLTMQNDANLVFYYGSSNNSPVWSSNKAVSGVKVTPPCFRPS